MGVDRKNFILASKILYLLFVIFGIVNDIFNVFSFFFAIFQQIFKFIANILMRGETELELGKLIPFVTKLAVCVFISLWLIINTIYNAGIK